METTPQISPQNPNQTPQPPAPPKTKKAFFLIIGGVLGLIVILGLVYWLIIKPKTSSPLAAKTALNNQAAPQVGSKPVFANISEQNQTATLEQAVKAGDFSLILEYLKEKDPNPNWLHQFDQAKINFTYSSDLGKLLPLYQATSGAIFKPQAYSYFSNSDNSYIIKIDGSVRNSQPYAAAALVLENLRKLYDFPQKSTTTYSGCIKGEEDIYTISTQFWGSLSPNQRSHMEGFDDTLLNKENSWLKAAQTNQLSELVNQHFAGICKGAASASAFLNGY